MVFATMAYVWIPLFEVIAGTTFFTSFLMRILPAGIDVKVL
jgi:hypothetical protein